MTTVPSSRHLYSGCPSLLFLLVPVHFSYFRIIRDVSTTLSLLPRHRCRCFLQLALHAGACSLRHRVEFLAPLYSVSARGYTAHATLGFLAMLLAHTAGHCLFFSIIIVLFPHASGFAFPSRGVVEGGH